MSDPTNSPMYSDSAMIGLNNWEKYRNDYKFVSFCIKELINTQDTNYKEKVLFMLSLYIDTKNPITNLIGNRRQEVLDFVEEFLKKQNPLG